MHTKKATPRLGALRTPEPIDRFALGDVVGRRNPRSGRLLSERLGVEWGGR